MDPVVAGMIGACISGVPVGVITWLTTRSKVNAETRRTEADAVKVCAEAESIEVKTMRVAIETWENLLAPTRAANADLQKELAELRADLRLIREHHARCEREHEATKDQLGELQVVVKELTAQMAEKK